MDNDFVLMTDDNCDLPFDFYEKNGIPYYKMNYTIDEITRRGGDISPKEFYGLLRQGKQSITSAGNTADLKALMEPIVKQGKPVLYLAFSSGLSATYNSGEMAAKELREKYPECRIIVIDTLCASLGQGLLVILANRMKQRGASIDEIAKWAQENRLRVAHYVMADDLMHLHRGGRVSKTSAIAGSLLGIKPMIYLDNEGHLTAIGKVRGKKQALTTVVDNLQKAVGKAKPDYFTVCHADCEEDAQFVAKLIKERFGIKEHLINYIGPVIGSHTGPGTIAAFLMAEHR